MSAYDKFRILWIDDCEGDSSDYQYPEPRLPDEFRDHFEIIRSPHLGGPSTVRNPQEFAELHQTFLAEENTDLLPADLVAMDYVLSKWSPGNRGIIADATAEDAAIEAMREENTQGVNLAAPEQNCGRRSATFEGLVIGLVYATLTSDHPTGLVPMTNYGDLLEGEPEVRALHDITRTILHVDYSRYGISGVNRAWANVIPQGVRSWRERLLHLVKTSRVDVSLTDLSALADNQSHPVLTISTRYGVRQYPTAGLFVDLQGVSEPPSGASSNEHHM
ncbi:MAG: hypothetical protein H6819_02250 [Phycisphaerales bacterium]|nr:hypothetical protein [Phycisphaerales bacterium]MCB9856966.1 hypothetical protein [Phycisphaerales bacterium]MCB9861907.1 hypothetical protein [Phycisphaerales bacterium]